MDAKRMMVAAIAAAGAMLGFADNSACYIQRGLVAQYDGIDNAGRNTHSSTATTWVDLTGNGHNATMGATQYVTWLNNGWSYTSTTTCNDKKPFVTSGLTATVNSKTFSVDLTMKNARAGTRGTYFANYNGTDGFTLENHTGSGGNTRLYYTGSPDFQCTAAKVTQNVVTHIGVTSVAARHIVYKDGEAKGTNTGNDNKNRNTSNMVIGGETCTTRDMNFRGEFYSLRLYNCELTADEMMINACIDRVRYAGVSLATANAKMPAGWSLLAGPLLQRTFGENLTINNSTLIEEDAMTLTGASQKLDFTAVKNGTTLALAGPFTVTGALTVSVPASLDVGDYTLVSASAVSGAITLDVSCATGAGTARTIEKTANAVILHVTAAASDAIGAGHYIKYGLELQFDGLDNAGTGTHDGSATNWKDLSGHGHDGEFTDQGSWTVNGRFNDLDGRMGWIGNFLSDIFAHERYSVEFVTTPVDTSRRYAYLSNYSSGNDAVTCAYENTVNKQLRLWNANSPNWLPAIYVNSGETSQLGFSVTPMHQYAFKNGVLGDMRNGAATMSSDGRRVAFGGENERNQHAFKGTYHALRIYSRPLSVDEMAINAAIDKIRYLNDPTPLAQLLPAGWSFDGDWKLHRAFSGNETIPCLYTVDGDATMASGTTLSLTRMDSGFKHIYVTGTLAVNGPVTLAIADASALAYGEYVLVDAEDLQLANGAGFTLAADIDWGANLAGELVTTPNGVMLRVYPAGDVYNNPTAKLNGTMFYWTPTSAADYSTGANWAQGGLGGTTGLVPGFNGDDWQYMIFTRPATIVFNSVLTWTGTHAYFCHYNGLDAPVVWDATDDAYGVDMTSQTSSAFCVVRGRGTTGYLKILRGTYKGRYFYTSGSADSCEYSHAKFELAGGSVSLLQAFQCCQNNYATADVVISGGKLDIAGDFNSNLNLGTTASFTMTGGEVTMDQDMQIGAGAASVFVGRQTGGTLTAKATFWFLGAHPHSAEYTLAGGRVVTDSILRANSVAKFVFAGGTLTPYTATANWMPQADFLTVDGTAIVDTDGKDVTFHGLLKDTAGGNAFSFTKRGAGMMVFAKPFDCTGTLAVEAGGISFQNASNGVYTAGTLKLSGGASIVFDVTADGADRLEIGTLDLSAASAENPVLIDIVYNGMANLDVGDSRTLIPSGVNGGDLAKLRIAHSTDELAVENGALVLKNGSRVTVTVDWTGAANDGGKWSTAGNWTALPQNGDTARFDTAGGTTAFDLDDVLFSGIVFGENAGAFTHAGEETLVVQNAITNLSASVQLIDTPVRLGVGGGEFEANTTGGLTITNNVGLVATTLTKKGAGELQIPDYTLASVTDVKINEGRVKLYRTGAVTTPSAGGTIEIAAGGALDINVSGASGNFAAGEPTHGKEVKIAGTGPDGAGALYNSVIDTTWDATFSKVELTGDAKVGGGGLATRALSNSANAPARVSMTGSDYALTVANDLAGHGFNFNNTDIDLKRMEVTGFVVPEGTLNGAVAEGIHFHNGSMMRPYSATMPATMPIFVEPGANVTLQADGGTSTVNGPLTIGEGATATRTGGQQLHFTGAVTNNGTFVMNSAGSAYFEGTNLVGGTYISNANHLWFSGIINSPESTVTMGGTGSLVFGRDLAGEGLPTLGTIHATSVNNLWFVPGTNVTMDARWNELLNASGTGGGIVRIHAKTTTSTTTVDNVTCTVRQLLVGWGPNRYGRLVLTGNSTVNVTGVMETGAEGENVLPTSLTIKDGATLNCTSTSGADLRFARYLSDAKTGGTGYTHELIVDHGTYTSPNAFTQFGRGSDYFYTRLVDGLVDVKGLQVRSLPPYRWNLHDERFIQTGGELRVGSLGMDSYHHLYFHPHADFANGTLKATDDFAVPCSRFVAAFGEDPRGGGEYAIDLNGHDVNWKTPLFGASDVTLSGNGSFASSQGAQGIPTGKWTVDATADLSGAAGFAGGLELAANAQATIDMCTTGTVQLLTVDNTYQGGAGLVTATLLEYDNVMPFTVSSLKELHTRYESSGDTKRPYYNNNYLLYRGEFYVSAEQAGEWNFAGQFDDNIHFYVDGTVVFASSGASAVGTGSRTLSEGWHEFRVMTYDGTGGFGPAVGAWKTSGMALGWSVDPAAKGSTDAASYTRFDTDTLPMRMLPQAKRHTSVRLRVAPKTAAATYNYDGKVYGGSNAVDVVTNDLACVNLLNACPMLATKDVRLDGYFHVPAANAGSWTFTGQYDDNITLEIDDTRLFETPSYTVSGSCEIVLEEGWHRFTIYAYDGAGSYGGKLTDDNGAACAIKAKAANAAKTLAFNGDNFRIVANGMFAQAFEKGGLGGETKLGAGSTLTNASAGAAPIYGTLSGSGSLAGKFAFAGGTWAMKGISPRLTEVVDTTGVANGDFLKGLAKIEVEFSQNPGSPKYRVGPAGALAASEAEAIVVEAKTPEGTADDWKATVLDGHLYLINPHPGGVVITIR